MTTTTAPATEIAPVLAATADAVLVAETSNQDYTPKQINRYHLERGISAEGEEDQGEWFVMLDRETSADKGETCACGCLGETITEKATFLPGHDQRLMGTLAFAYGEGLEVQYQMGGMSVGTTAAQYGAQVLTETGQAKLAAYFDNAREIRSAKANKPARAPRAPKVAKADALPSVVKVGRWEYPVVDVERDGNGEIQVVHYTNKTGDTVKTVKWGSLA